MLYDVPQVPNSFSIHFLVNGWENGVSDIEIVVRHLMFYMVIILDNKLQDMVTAFLQCKMQTPHLSMISMFLRKDGIPFFGFLDLGWLAYLLAEGLTFSSSKRLGTSCRLGEKKTYRLLLKDKSFFSVLLFLLPLVLLYFFSVLFYPDVSLLFPDDFLLTTSWWFSPIFFPSTSFLVYSFSFFIFALIVYRPQENLSII